MRTLSTRMEAFHFLEAAFPARRSNSVGDTCIRTLSHRVCSGAVQYLWLLSRTREVSTQSIGFPNLQHHCLRSLPIHKLSNNHEPALQRCSCFSVLQFIDTTTPGEIYSLKRAAPRARPPA